MQEGKKSFKLPLFVVLLISIVLFILSIFLRNQMEQRKVTSSPTIPSEKQQEEPEISLDEFFRTTPRFNVVDQEEDPRVFKEEENATCEIDGDTISQRTAVSGTTCPAQPKE